MSNKDRHADGVYQEMNVPQMPQITAVIDI